MQILNLAGALQSVRFEEGTYIIKEGEEGNVFYLIQDGTVKVTKRNTSGEEVI
jgi:CRP-like cAMP-binding protein